MRIGTSTVCPMNAPSSVDPNELPMSTSYCAGSRFALTLSLPAGNAVMAPVPQAAVAVSDTVPKLLPTRVATPVLLTVMYAVLDDVNAMYRLGAIHALCVPDTASAYWVPSLKVTATSRGWVVPLTPTNVSCVQPVVWASELTCTRVFTTLILSGAPEIEAPPTVPDTE